jgi:hypothetical protein
MLGNKKLFTLIAVLVVSAGFPSAAQASAVAWANGVGFGGATLTATDPGGTRSWAGRGFGGAGTVTSPKGLATASGTWGALWSVTIGGTAGPASSYGHERGDGGLRDEPPVESASSLLGVSGEIVGGPGDWQLHLLGTGSATLNAEWQLGVFRIPAERIPDGFLGTPADLISQGYASAADLLYYERSPVGQNSSTVVDVFLPLWDPAPGENLAAEVAGLSYVHGAVPAPEPAALGLLAFGGLLLPRRRRFA